ncbi:MAG: hypothetical protein RLY86_1853 [Pseudomonadota bacterium]|jgi:anti-anti-sigma factor
MDYSVQQTDDGILVKLSGRMTLVDHDKFREVVDQLEKMKRDGVCVFDLSALQFVDSSGLGMFLIARDVAMPKDVEIILKGAQDSVGRVLDIAKFGTLFTVQG